METIIGLLFILLPVIFKLIGKRLEQSGNADKAEKLKELARKLGNEEEEEEFETPIPDWLEGTPKLDKDMYVEYDEDGHVVSAQPRDRYVPKQPEPVVAPAYVRVAKTEGEAQFKPVSRKRPMLEESEPQKKREKIDPKKLVIYSEIMKPKFDE